MSAKIYGYFALKDIKGFTWYNPKTKVIGNWDIKKGDALYIGIDTNGERHRNHIKPSKRDEQVINTFIQDYEEGEDWILKDEIGSAANKELVHPIEMQLVNDFEPVFNIYGATALKERNPKLRLQQLDPNALIKEDDHKVNKGIKYFDNLGALREMIDASKMDIFTRPERMMVIIAAKDSGKSYPLDLYKIMGMEQDPNANAITLMKYSGESAEKGIASLVNILGELKEQGFKLKRDYEATRSNFLRLPKGKKAARTMDVKLQSQFVKFGSFEKSDRLAGFKLSNGGYPFLIHIEEPVMQNDTKETPTAKKWDADVKTIHNTVYRTYRDYKLKIQPLLDAKKKAIAEGKPYKAVHEPIPYKIIITMNDWDPMHILSRRAQHYFPQERFLDLAVGDDYSKQLELYKDKIIDSDTVVPELRAWVDERWEDIKESVLNKHTAYVPIEYDAAGKYVNTCYVRMTAFGNPNIRGDEESRTEKYHEMYNALITGDSHGLAQSFGMGYGGSDDEDRRFVIKKMPTADTENVLKEPGRETLGFCMGWDHDANRGPVGTPVSMTAIKVNNGNPWEPDYEYTDYKWLVHEQIAIDGYGKGQMGQTTKLYHDMMVEITRQAYDKYVGHREKYLPTGKFAIFDDDDGSYVGHIGPLIREFGFDSVDCLPNKNGKFENGGFGVIDRDDMWQFGLDSGKIVIDYRNKTLLDWIKLCPSVSTPVGTKKRSTHGKWGARYKDISNSAEYALFPWRNLIKYNYDG